MIETLPTATTTPEALATAVNKSPGTAATGATGTTAAFADLAARTDAAAAVRAPRKAA